MPTNGNGQRNGGGVAESKLIWWIMGIIAFGVTASLSIVYSNMKDEVTQLRSTCNENMKKVESDYVTRREFTPMEAFVADIRMTQVARSERITAIESNMANAITNFRNDIAMIKESMKELNTFVRQYYSPAYGPIKPVYPTVPTVPPLGTGEGSR